jgi:hypothetical protein
MALASPSPCSRKRWSPERTSTIGCPPRRRWISSAPPDRWGRRCPTEKSIRVSGRPRQTMQRRLSAAEVLIVQIRLATATDRTRAFRRRARRSPQESRARPGRRPGRSSHAQSPRAMPSERAVRMPSPSSGTHFMGAIACCNGTYSMRGGLPLAAPALATPHDDLTSGRMRALRDDDDRVGSRAAPAQMLCDAIHVAGDLGNQDGVRTAREAFRPGASPPPVLIAMRRRSSVWSSLQPAARRA